MIQHFIAMKLTDKLILAISLTIAQAFAPSLIGAGGASSLCAQNRAAEEISKAAADSAYAQENYSEAAQIYQTLIDSLGESAVLYYNLGNCYFRQDSIARAILNYERARLLDPTDDDLAFNLEMARTKTVDKVAPANDMFFVTLFRSLVLSMTVRGWKILGISAFVLMLLGAAVYLFAPALIAKKMGFTAAVLLLIICIFANIAAAQQRSQVQHRTGAILMAPSAVVKSTPSASGTDLFILHEGTHVQIVDDSMREWVEVRMSDGKEGWLQRNEIEVI